MNEIMRVSDARKALWELGDKSRVPDLKRFFKTGPGEYAEGDQFIGVSVPDNRKTARRCKQLWFPELEELIISDWHEERLLGLLILVQHAQKKNPDRLEECAHHYLRLKEYVNNWDLVDSSAYKILGPWIARSQELDILFELAGSANLWDRRISMISCYHFIRNQEFELALQIAQQLLYDQHDLIQKAVGWMLREIGNRDLQTEIEFLLPVYQKIPRTTLRYAIERFPKEDRKKWLSGEC